LPIKKIFTVKTLEILTQLIHIRKEVESGWVKYYSNK